MSDQTVAGSRRGDWDLDIARRFTGGAFVAAAVALWCGWMLLPARPGAYFQEGDFAAVYAHLRWWIWIYRVHIFGMVIAVIALTSLAAMAARSPARVIVWPAVAVADAGMIVGALAAAFYYHHGVWGAMTLEGKGTEEIVAFIAALEVDTEYVTCLTRFSRVFSGLGLVLLGFGLFRWKLLPAWIAALGAAIGLAAMALTMGLPDDLSLYLPVFHLLAFWLLATGAVIVRGGVAVPD